MRIEDYMLPNRSTSPVTKPIRRNKRATNLSLSIDVLEAANALDINLSQVCDAYLRGYLRHEQERRWRAEHADYIAAYNASIDKEGLPLDAWRTF